MTPREWRYASVLGAAVVLAVVVPWLASDPVDWSDSFARDDTRPYGSRVLFESLPALVPAADTVRAVSATPYQWLQEEGGAPASDRSAYLFVAPQLQLDPPGTRAVLDYVADGHVAFLAAQGYGGPLADSLGLDTGLNVDLESVTAAITDSATARLRLTAANRSHASGVRVRPDAVRYAFTAVDTARTAVLGTTAGGAPTLVRTDWGDGHLILSTTPRVFTNYHALNSASAPYVWGALSHLPADAEAIWWDAHHKPGTVREQNIMRVVLGHPALRTAYWLLLAGALLFVLTRGRRRQRAVPVVAPPRNRTLEFVRHVGQLYYERGRAIELARTKIEYFQAFVRRRLDLPGGPPTDDWIDRVARRAGVPRPDVAAVAEMMETVQHQSSLSDATLKQLDDRLDTFYDQAVS
jgi:hypothetical protein